MGQVLKEEEVITLTPTESDPSTDTPDKVYQLLDEGKLCPEGLLIDTPEECDAALASLGVESQPPWMDSRTTLPPGCTVRDGGSGQRRHFNTDFSSTAARADLAPVCNTPGEGPPPAPTRAPPQGKGPPGVPPAPAAPPSGKSRPNPYVSGIR